MTTITQILAEAFNRVKAEHGVTLSRVSFTPTSSGALAGLSFKGTGKVTSHTDAKPVRINPEATSGIRVTSKRLSSAIINHLKRLQSDRAFDDLDRGVAPMWHLAPEGTEFVKGGWWCKKSTNGIDVYSNGEWSTFEDDGLHKILKPSLPIPEGATHQDAEGNYWLIPEKTDGLWCIRRDDKWQFDDRCVGLYEIIYDNPDIESGQLVELATPYDSEVPEGATHKFGIWYVRKSSNGVYQWYSPNGWISL